jgi:N-acetylglucosamine-6-phosphate deacetylase
MGNPYANRNVRFGPLGAIVPGYRADLVAFRSNFEVINTWVGGRSYGGQRGEPALIT